MSELFDIPEHLSPRVEWMRRHRIRTLKGNDEEEGEPWGAWVGEEGRPLQGEALTFAPTEDEALARLAKRLGLKLWNEEGRA